MNHQRIRLSLVSTLLTLATILSVSVTTSSVQAKALGRVIDLQGTMQIKRRGNDRFQPGDRGMVLNQGDILKLLPKARVLVLCTNGQRWQVPEGISGVSNECALREPVYTPDGLRLPTRQGDDVVLLTHPYWITPRDTALLNPLPVLQWNAVSQVQTYQVQIHQDDTLIWESQVTGNEITYPGTPVLTSGMTYTLTVKTADRAIQSQTRMTLLDDTQRAQVEIQRDRILQQPWDKDIQALILADLYNTYGLSTDAISVLKARLQQGSQNLALLNQLGKLYQQVNFYPLAETHYLHVVKLAKPETDEKATAQTGLLELAHQHIQAKRYNNAEILLKYVENTDKISMKYNILTTRAWMQLEQSRYQDAEESLEAAIQLNSDRPEAYCVFTVLLKQQNRDADAASKKCQITGTTD